MIVSIDDLQQHLASKFDIKVMHDLGDMSDSPGSLMKALSGAYQKSYETNQRLVFYTSRSLPEKFLHHLYETFNFLDISNWFVLIVGADCNKQKIIECCEKFSADPVPFQFLEANIETTKEISNGFLLPDTICAIPWTNLEILPDGMIEPCCAAKSVHLGNIMHTTLDAAFNSDKLQNLRRRFLAGEKPQECRGCWEVEDKNLTSIRMHNNKRLKKNFLLKYLDQPRLATLDLKFNNICNFKCRICQPESSSLFAQEEHRFRNIPLVTQNNWGESDWFLDQLGQHLCEITNIDMYGGEPFLLKKLQRVLKLAVDNGYAKDIRLHYNSNGSIWPESFLPYWPKFREVDIHFSIDAVGPQFELQRGGEWSKIQNNILKLRDLAIPNLTIRIMPTISVLNVLYIDQVYDWSLKHGFPIFVNYAHGDGIELSNLTAEAKQLIVDKFKDHPWQELQDLIKNIKNFPDNNGEKFKTKMQWFDKIRQEDFSESHPEIAKAMGYV